ncbi:hypothetical protein GCM10011378_42740 [Hymenobacter glacieicola]|uniref:Uncharacterized protein n=1 Tax=Hymenobacter glacieicola TaxID=1562124 RepID=A0ABQ1X9A6_9BACT|nr:hypothetical protein GCM10011378_42740 [Hymenobacter glacieicola]
MLQLNIPESNFLRKIPRLLDKRDALHIETIRICIDSIYLDYDNLYQNLLTYNSIHGGGKIAGD